MCITVDIKCPKCKKKICEANQEAEIKAVCPRCKNKFEYPLRVLNHKVNVLSTEDVMKNRSGAYKFLDLENTNK